MLLGVLHVAAAALLAAVVTLVTPSAFAATAAWLVLRLVGLLELQVLVVQPARDLPTVLLQVSALELGHDATLGAGCEITRHVCLDDLELVERHRHLVITGVTSDIGPVLAGQLSSLPLVKRTITLCDQYYYNIFTTFSQVLVCCVCRWQKQYHPHRAAGRWRSCSDEMRPRRVTYRRVHR